VGGKIESDPIGTSKGTVKEGRRMYLRFSLAVGAISLWAVPLVTHAGSLECRGTIVSEGDSEQQLLEACGDPASREGSNWTYEFPGSLPRVVSIGNGVIMFIRDADEVPAASGSPLGDSP
jgi:hypothetical protein